MIGVGAAVPASSSADLDLSDCKSKISKISGRPAFRRRVRDDAASVVDGVGVADKNDGVERGCRLSPVLAPHMTFRNFPADRAGDSSSAWA